MRLNASTYELRLIQELIGTVRSQIRRTLLELPIRRARLVAAGLVGGNLLMAPIVGALLVPVFTVPAAAQVDDVGSAMCGTGLGQLVVIAFAAVSLYLIVKGAFRGAMAFDKMGSSRSERQYEGKQELVGAGKTTAGAFVPPIFGAILEIVGINTVSCISFDTGLLGMALPALPL